MFRVHHRLAALAILALPLWGATESLYPENPIAAQTGYTNCTYDEIDEDPDSPDAAWCDTGGASNTNTTVRVTFPTPSGTLTTGAGVQEFRVQWRKTNFSANPTCAVDLYENGSLVSALESHAISSTAGVVESVPWNASLLTAGSGVNVEVLVTCTVGGGPAGNRASGEVGAIEWNVDYSAATSRFNRMISVN